MKLIQNQTFDAERALYGEKDIRVIHCAFDGPADGESAFKEGSDIEVQDGFFNLRYPFWHDQGLEIRDSRDDGALPCRPVVFPPHRPSPARSCTASRRCASAVMLHMRGLRHRLPGIRLVGAGH